MYVIGHCVTTIQTGRVTADQVFGDDAGLAALMLPDYLRCHDWGYERCFADWPDDRDSTLIRAHMLGDWYVHYGTGRERRRIGWAYRRMGIFARRYDEFFAVARGRGLCNEAEPTDSPRGFSHTMMEYCIDTWLARHGTFDRHLAPARRILGALGSQSCNATGSWAWMHDVAGRAGIAIDDNQLAEDVASFSRRAGCAQAADELAYRAGVKKFKLVDTDESMAYIAETIHAGLDQISDGEMEDLVAAIGQFIARELS